MTLSRFKKIVKWIVGISTGWTIANIISNNVAPRNNRHKVEAAVGATVIGGMVAEAAEQYTDKTIDELADAYKAARAAFKNP